MPNLSAIISSNIVSASSLQGTPVAVFVGGTSGIGQGMAEAFARWTGGKAHIIIVGRNRNAADEIIASLPKPQAKTLGSDPDRDSKTDVNKEWTHEFVECDATLMKNVHKASSEILARYPKINFLVETQGIMTTDGRNETSEGIDRKLAVHYYSRWKFIDDLLPALRKAKEEGEEAKVMSVFSAGKGGEIDMNDLGLIKTFSLKNAGLQIPTYTDMMMEEFSKRNPGLSFIHAYPGGVKTNILSNSPSSLVRITGAVASVLISPLVISKETCAEYMWYSVFQNGGSNGGAFRTGSRGENLGMKRYFGNEEQRTKVWDHTVEVMRKALGHE